MNLEEIDEFEADEKSQEVDSRDEVMHVGKSDKWFLEYRAGGWSSKTDNRWKSEYCQEAGEICERCELWIN